MSVCLSMSLPRCGKKNLIRDALRRSVARCDNCGLDTRHFRCSLGLHFALPCGHGLLVTRILLLWNLRVTAVFTSLLFL